MNRVPKKSLVVALHDVCPPFEAEFHSWRKLLDKWGVPRRSIAVVPFQNGASPLRESPTLVDALHEETQVGSEILLHGYTHVHERTYPRMRDRFRDRLTTRGCAEFSDLSPEEALERARKGLREIQPFLPTPIRGFTPPGWWMDAHAIQSLDQLAFSFCTTTFGIIDLRRGRTIRAPVIVGLPQSGFFPFLLHGYSFRILPVFLQKQRVLRIALHPYDLDNPRFLRETERLIRQAVEEREICVYGELIS
jgi:predicted deacetylase